MKWVVEITWSGGCTFVGPFNGMVAAENWANQHVDENRVTWRVGALVAHRDAEALTFPTPER